MVGVNRPSLERSDRVLDKARLVERVRVERGLFPRQKVSKARGKGVPARRTCRKPSCSCRSPLVSFPSPAPSALPSSSRRTYLVQLETACTKAHLVLEPRRPSIIPLAREAKVHGNAVRGGHHAVHVRLRRCARRGVRAGRRSSPTADERRLTLVSLAKGAERDSRCRMRVPPSTAGDR